MLPVHFQGENWPPSFMTGFAKLVDRLPGSDKQSVSRLARIREQARRESWPPAMREAEEYCKAPDWNAIGNNLYGDKGWREEDLQQFSAQEILTFLQEALQDSLGQAHAPATSGWSFIAGLVHYHGVEIPVHHTHRRLLERLHDAKGQPVSLEALRDACAVNNKNDDSTMRGYMSRLRTTIIRALGLDKKVDGDPIIGKDRTYRLSLL